MIFIKMLSNRAYFVKLPLKADSSLQIILSFLTFSFEYKKIINTLLHQVLQIIYTYVQLFTLNYRKCHKYHITSFQMIPITFFVFFWNT